MTISAALFGFAPERPVWFRRQDEVRREEIMNDPRASTDARVGWWTGWLNVGPVPEDEAHSMADALDRAHAWYRSHPGAVPDWLDPYPRWDWKGIGRLLRNPALVETLPRVAAFLRLGGFEATVRREPWANVLRR